MQTVCAQEVVLFQVSVVLVPHVEMLPAAAAAPQLVLGTLGGGENSTGAHVDVATIKARDCVTV